MSKRILIVEDEAGLREGLSTALSLEGYSCDTASDGSTGLQMATEMEFDLVLLDLRLPKMDGLQVLERVRKSHPLLPVIVLTARGLTDDKVAGLKMGADDYVVKPFAMPELMARMESVLRRTPITRSPKRCLRFQDLCIDLVSRAVTRQDQTICHLSPREGELLGLLAQSAPRAVSRQELLQLVWHVDLSGAETRAVDMAVNRLRDKIGADSIRTVHGQGYLFCGDMT